MTTDRQEEEGNHDETPAENNSTDVATESQQALSEAVERCRIGSDDDDGGQGEPDDCMNNNSNHHHASTTTITDDETDDPVHLHPPPLYKFVFTGGPCGGKTTALARVFTYLKERHFEVMAVPEGYSLLANHGLNASFYSSPNMDIVVQSSLLDLQMALEDSVANILQARNKPAVMICDRGTMDGLAYMTKRQFEAVLQKKGTNMVEVRDNRYDAIFHLVTAADGADAFYTLENNAVRTETPAEAIALDQKTQHAWLGHPHLYVFKNAKQQQAAAAPAANSFEVKMNRLINVMSKIVGLPSNLKKRSAKYLLRDEPDLTQFPNDVHYQIFEVEKVYLQQTFDMNNIKSRGSGTAAAHAAAGSSSFLIQYHPQNYSFIRRRTNIDEATGKAVGSVYQLTRVHFTTTKTTIPATEAAEEEQLLETNGRNHHQSTDETGDEITTTTTTTTTTSSGSGAAAATTTIIKETTSYVEQKRIISKREFETMYLTARDKRRHVVQQRRISFLYKKQSFCVHMYVQPAPGLCILHAQVEDNSSSSSSNSNSTSSPPCTPCKDDTAATTVPVTSTDNNNNTNGNNDNSNNSSSNAADDLKVELPPFLTIERKIEDTKEDEASFGAYNLSLLRPHRHNSIGVVLKAN